MTVYTLLAYETLRTLGGPLVSMGLRLKIEGEQNIPLEGGALLVSNYYSLLDPIALACSVDRPIHFIPGPKGVVMPLVRTFYSLGGGLLLSSRTKQWARASRRRSVDLLEMGELVGMFPEGIGPFSNPRRRAGVSFFRTECAHIALRSKAPLIPVAVISSRKIGEPSEGAFSSGDTGLRLVRDKGADKDAHHGMLIRVGKPILLGNYYKEPVTKSLVDSLSGKFRRVVTKLYQGKDLDRFLTGRKPFDIYTDRV